MVLIVVPGPNKYKTSSSIDSIINWAISCLFSSIVLPNPELVFPDCIKFKTFGTLRYP
ncbi:hypothetical protein ES703_81959 [subsurface metagenome]